MSKAPWLLLARILVLLLWVPYFYSMLVGVNVTGQDLALIITKRSIPLFVRSPYLSCWGYLSDGPSNLSIPQTTTFSQDLQPRSGWDPSLDVLNLVVLVRVDNSTYLFLGNATTVNTTVNLTNVVISPTQTKLTAEAGPMQINLTFLNPIESKDRVKQSIPFSYMSLTAESLDGAAHAMQVYADLNIEWVSGEPTNLPFMYTAPEQINETGVFNYAINPQPAWGTLYYGMKSLATQGGHGDITANVAVVSASRDIFRVNGVLGDQIMDTNHPAPDYNSKAFAISRDLGTIQATQDPVISVVGYDVNLIINYTDLSGATQQRKLLYQDQYGGKGDILADFIGDFANASSRAQELDLNILQHAAPISGPLADLVSLATAQVYGSVHLTASIDANGYFNKSDVMAFMRNIGGLEHKVGLFLEPLFRLQASQKYTNQYAAADIDSGNMLIMTYAHARASGDVSLIARYYDLLTSWADYLSNATLLVHNQFSADGLSANNQTNLAIKGIIAIKAMSKMNSIVKRDADIDKYSSAAASLYARWESLALTGDKHLLATYNQVYNGQSNFINNISLDLDFGNSGMPVDNIGSGAGYLRPVSSWSLFAAAMMPNQDQRTNLISKVHNRESTYPLTPFGQTVLGGPRRNVCATGSQSTRRPKTVDSTATGTSSKPHTSLSLSVIIKGVIGGVAAFLAIGAMAMVVWRRQRQSHEHTSVGPSFLSKVMSLAANESRSQPTDGRESTPLSTVATDTGEPGGAAAGTSHTAPFVFVYPRYNPPELVLPPSFRAVRLPDPILSMAQRATLIRTRVKLDYAGITALLASRSR
ncbi:hypothetical protein H4582DRAFT_2052271 [Lactarius indigo]|nr:hypothetical protein H4582DRAFT_2052271 [Lactarius indigo]